MSVRALPVDGAHLRRTVPLLPVAEARSRRLRWSRVSLAHRSLQLDLHWKTNEKISGRHITVTYMIFNFKKNILLQIWSTVVDSGFSRGGGANS